MKIQPLNSGFTEGCTYILALYVHSIHFLMNVHEYFLLVLVRRGPPLPSGANSITASFFSNFYTVVRRSISLESKRERGDGVSIYSLQKTWTCRDVHDVEEDSCAFSNDM